MSWLIKFENVGRQKRNWVIQVSDIDTASTAIVRSIAKSKALMSRDVEFTINKIEGSNVMTGWIFAGLITVGNITAEEIPK